MTIAAIEPQAETLHLIVETSGERLDKLLKEHYPTFSRTYFQQLIEQGFVLLNGKIAKKRIIPDLGDEIEVCFQLSKETFLEPENIPLDIVFEDEHLLVINKPAGMVVHPGSGHKSGTFANALLHHCEHLIGTDPIRPGIVHRLDKDTSGLLIAAKTPLAHRRLVEAFAERRVEKSYLALCIGSPKNGVVSAPIGRHPHLRKEMAVLPEGGKPAESHIQVLAHHEQLSLVLIRPKTGRTHQIRVHLKHLGHPVLGDEIYGSSRANASFRAPRQQLHAFRLQLSHPITGKLLELCAPLPEDMKLHMELFANASLS